MTQHLDHSVVAIFDTHPKAEAALRRLQAAGVDMKRLSIIGKDFQTEEHAVGFFTSGDRVRFWGGRGAAWGALWGMLFGGAFLFVPVIGPLVVMGPLVGWLLGALEGAAVGAAVGAVAAALQNAGLPQESAVRYDAELRTGKFLVMALGPEAMVNHARSVLSESGAVRVETHALVKNSRAELISRQSVLLLLNDQEVAKVSNAESGKHLSDGDEYLDLEHLGLGVQRAHRVPDELGRVLPRKSVAEGTWLAVLEHLKRPEPRPAVKQ